MHPLGAEHGPLTFLYGASARRRAGRGTTTAAFAPHDGHHKAHRIPGARAWHPHCPLPLTPSMGANIHRGWGVPPTECFPHPLWMVTPTLRA